jgi:predicted AAA+ superfamily ATPase
MRIKRAISDSVLEAARSYPVVAITGPRQSGKTTLVRWLFQDLPYVLLEEPDLRRYATEDPRGFLSEYREGAVLDEAQRAPELFSYIQGIVDEDPKPGRFILTGSQQFGPMSRISQSLAGRVAMMILLPFSLGELIGAGVKLDRLEDVLYNGGYPPIYDRELEASSWYANYVATYVERDVRQLVSVRDLSSFETFLRMCAARCGQLVNLAGLANNCGISHNTARSWLSVLEASYIVRTLPSHHRNFSKRLIKSPKLYFLDPGLAAWLLEIRNPGQISNHSMRGPLFETWVFSEILKRIFNRGTHPSLYFWRDRAGLEVDFVADLGEHLIPIEAKSGATFVYEWLSPLKRWSELAGKEAGPGWIVYGGDTGGRRNAFETVPWHRIEQLTNAVF